MADSMASAADAGVAHVPAAARPAVAPAPLGARSRTHAGWELAPDEAVVWEGRPDAFAFALRTLKLPVVAAYFGALVAWRLVEAYLGMGDLWAVAMPLGSGILTVAALFGLAVMVARTTRYLVTTDRVILRYGAALPRSLSVPFRQVAALSVSVGRGGRGDVALRLRSGNRIPYLKLWPHVRPWRLRHPEPTLCAVADAGSCAARLSRRLADAERKRSQPPAAPLERDRAA